MIQRLYEMAKRQGAADESEKRESGNGNGDEGVEESGSVVEFGDGDEEEGEEDSQDDPENVCDLLFLFLFFFNFFNFLIF
jgi:hypothetical protein